MNKPPLIFDRSQVRHMRHRARTLGKDGDFLRAEVTRRLFERLNEVNRHFDRALIIGAPDILPWPARQVITASSLSLSPTATFILDEECLPVAECSVDLIISVLDLHWVNDLPGALAQFNRALKPDGLFLGSLFCAGTLSRLKTAFLAVESAQTGGASPHIAPFADIRDLGGLLQRAGFAMPVADVDWLDIRYKDTFALFNDLRQMGETNALITRRKYFSGRAHFLALAEHYQNMAQGPDGRVGAEFAIAFLTGWAPSPDQPKAKRPGSATARLADALKVPEEKF